MKKFISSILIASSLLSLTSCGSLSGTSGLILNMPKSIDYKIAMPMTSANQTFRDLDRPVRVVAHSSVTQSDMVNMDGLSAKAKRIQPEYNFSPSVKQFAQESTTAFMQQMGFDVNSSADYRLIIDVKTFQIYWENDITIKAKVDLSYRLVDEAGESVVPSASVSSTADGGDLGSAYADALRKINWERIADQLKVSKSAKREANKQVTGAGDTALEHTVIRWNIESRPGGADVTWRVISSTPDVSNSMSNYVGNTPYESTESFDIKGLTYNNSGNVQIEVTCERNGYLPQKKRFNLRQVLDQKEISAMFKLVKDED